MAIVENLEKMLAAGRDDAMLRFGLGSAYFNAKEYEKAIPHLSTCIAQDPDYSAAYKLLGRSLMQMGEPAHAAKVFADGLLVSRHQGDKQSEKEIMVFMKKLGETNP